jgi:diaminopimelate decarboxylase
LRTPAYVFDEADFRGPLPRLPTAFAGADVFYAAKAFCRQGVVRIVAEEGLNARRLHGRRAGGGARPGCRRAHQVHGNNKSIAELRRAVDAGVGWIVVDSFDEIAA